MPSLSTILNGYLNWGNPPGEGPLRPGGVSRSLDVAGEQDLPSTPSPAAKRQAPALQIMRDCWQGTQRVRSRSTEYLPQNPAEDPVNYQSRLKRAVFFNATRTTAEGLTGMVFRKDPKLGDDVPEPIKAHWENIDNAGTHGDVFCRAIFQDALVAGHAAILVDFPTTGGKQSIRDEQGPNGIRPYWVPIRKEDIMSWRTAVEGGMTVLTQFVLRECTSVPDGHYGEKVQERYRVLSRENGVVGFQLLEVASDNKSVRLADSGVYLNQSEIPIAEIPTSGRTGLFESEPPLLDLTYLNVAHYQQQSDYATALHKCGVPILVRIGANISDGQPQTIVVGPNAAIDLPKDADAKYISHDGSALASMKAALDDLVSQMSALGLSMLAPDKRAAETATAKRLDREASDSALAVSARGLQDGIERALQFHANYLRLPSGGSIAINRDFGSVEMTPEMVQALSTCVSQGQLTPETMWRRLQQGNVLPEGFDAEQEKAELDADAEIKRVLTLESGGDNTSTRAA